MKRRKVLAVSVGFLLLLVLGGIFILFGQTTKGNNEVKNFAKQSGLIASRRFIQKLQSSYDDSQWWKSDVFYEIFVRSFYDSNGDGIGDINGVIEKLDYLNDGNPATNQDLGVTALWLMPIFTSPSYHGYDVIDYFTINPDYGTLEDFKRLVSEAHKRGMRVIIDLVINHTSIENPWFNASMSNESDFHNWYIWSDTDPGYLGPWNEQVWYPAENGEYYYGVFWSGMPDLNLQNPEVTTEIEKIANYWVSDVGVDGFRLDAARHLIEDGKKQTNTPATLEWLSNFQTFNKSISPTFLSVGEVWDSSYVTMNYLKANSLDLVFDFDLSSAIVNTLSTRNAQGLSANINNELLLFPNGGIAIFLTNHDMNRSMSQLGGDRNLMVHAATILLTLPGTPFIYYGEEIGMTGMKPDELIRTPMQWSTDAYAGFSNTIPWEPVNNDYQLTNVTAENHDTDSLLSYYRTLIKIRNAHPALQQGQYYSLSSPENEIYAAIQTYDMDMVLIVMNLSKNQISNMKLTFEGGLEPGKYSLIDMLGTANSTINVEENQNTGKIEFTLLSTLDADQDCIFYLIKE